MFIARYSRAFDSTWTGNTYTVITRTQVKTGKGARKGRKKQGRKGGRMEEGRKGRRKDSNKKIKKERKNKEYKERKK